MKLREISIDGLPLDDEMRSAVLADTAIAGAIVYRRQAGTRVSAFGPGCDDRTLEDAVHRHPEASAVWRRDAPVRRATSRTARALELLAVDPGLTPHEAAKKVGLDSASVYR